MDDFIAKNVRHRGTCSYLIAKIANETKSENFEHLIIITDENIYEKDIDKCDELVTNNNIQISYFSVDIIGDGGK